MAPVQRVTDFMAGEISTGDLPLSSYRLGVRSAALHDIYSPAITAALRTALLRFDRQMPGFLSSEGLLHGVETRTSSPLQIGTHPRIPLCLEISQCTHYIHTERNESSRGTDFYEADANFTVISKYRDSTLCLLCK